MNVLMIILCLILLMLVNVSTENMNDEDFDPVIDFLLNGKPNSSENVTDEPVNLTAGIWKCGNCTDLDDSQIVYSEENYFDADDENDDDVETKIELVLEGMRCVTVSADKPGVVQRLTGACDGAVTLHLTSVRHFVVHVYV